MRLHWIERLRRANAAAYVDVYGADYAANRFGVDVATVRRWVRWFRDAKRARIPAADREAVRDFRRWARKANRAYYDARARAR